VRQWCRTFGQADANGLRRRRLRPGDTWHLDAVFMPINGQQHYLWRAVDQDGNVRDILVQSRRNKAAARKFFRKLLKDFAYVPRVLITDKLGSYDAARRAVLPSVEHRRHKGLNNRAENAHQPTRARERRIGASRVRATHNASSPPMARSPATSDPVATAYPRPSTAKPAPNAAPPGGRSPAPRRGPEQHAPQDSPRLRAPAHLPLPVSLTMSQRHMRDARPPRRAGQLWAMFLRNHAADTWACSADRCPPSS